MHTPNPYAFKRQTYYYMALGGCLQVFATVYCAITVDNSTEKRHPSAVTGLSTLHYGLHVNVLPRTHTPTHCWWKLYITYDTNAAIMCVTPILLRCYCMWLSIASGLGRRQVACGLSASIVFVLENKRHGVHVGEHTQHCTHQSCMISQIASKV